MKEQLEAELQLARSDMRKLSGSAPLSKRRDVEVRYALAYDRLARMGFRNRLQQKYRP